MSRFSSTVSIGFFLIRTIFDFSESRAVWNYNPTPPTRKRFSADRLIFVINRAICSLKDLKPEEESSKSTSESCPFLYHEVVTLSQSTQARLCLGSFELAGCCDRAFTDRSGATESADLEPV
jgi:hypothetical protein